MDRLRPVLGGRRSLLTLLALAAIVAGAILIVVAIRSRSVEPRPVSRGRINVTPPSSPSTRPTSGPSQSPGRPARTPKTRGPLLRSLPVTITIPAIGVRSQVRPIGLTRSGALAVPQPGPNLNKAAWFKNSPTPGQPGVSIIEGHVDTTVGPSVFQKLGSVRPGDKILVVRADRVTVVFTVNAVRDFLKSKFPTRLVYGAPDLSQPLLRLITCSDFDAALRTHIGNEIVFAHLTKIDRSRAHS